MGKVRQDDPPEGATSNGPTPLPRTSEFRPAVRRSFDGDPRAIYTRALVNMGRVGDVAHLLVPSEILEAFCEAVAEPLDLVVAVLIEAPEGLPRSLPWKSPNADWKLVEHAERRAWANYAELLAPELLESLPAQSSGAQLNSQVHWTVQTLVIPLVGILQCGTGRPIRDADNGLLKYMSGRLSMALERYLTRT